MALDHYQRTREVFRRTALECGGYYDAKPGTQPEHSRWQRRVRHLARALLLSTDPELRSPTVLSVGCGRGDFELLLREQLNSIRYMVGLDFVPEALVLARASASTQGDPYFAAADVLALPLPDRAFDVTLCINVLHHIRSAEQGRALHELARVTGEHLIVEIKNADQAYFGRLRPRRSLGVSIAPTSERQVTAMLTSSGFALRSARHIFRFKELSPLSVLLYSRSG